jgi:hypothetical protein
MPGYSEGSEPSSAEGRSAVAACDTPDTKAVQRSGIVNEPLGRWRPDRPITARLESAHSVSLATPFMDEFFRARFVSGPRVLFPLSLKAVLRTRAANRSRFTHRGGPLVMQPRNCAF